jgi:hypothetical protein
MVDTNMGLQTSLGHISHTGLGSAFVLALRSPLQSPTSHPPTPLAPWQTSGCALRATRRPAALQNFWATRTASGLRATASLGGDVWACR